VGIWSVVEEGARPEIQGAIPPQVYRSDVRYYSASSPGPIGSRCAYAGAPPCGKPRPEDTRNEQRRVINQSSICIMIVIILSENICNTETWRLGQRDPRILKRSQSQLPPIQEYSLGEPENYEDPPAHKLRRIKGPLREANRLAMFSRRFPVPDALSDYSQSARFDKTHVRDSRGSFVSLEFSSAKACS
jgi:hypothetical protein